MSLVTINIEKKFFFILFSLVLLFGGFLIVKAYGTSTPTIFGHSIKEVEGVQAQFLAMGNPGPYYLASNIAFPTTGTGTITYITVPKATFGDVGYVMLNTVIEGTGNTKCPQARLTLVEVDDSDIITGNVFLSTTYKGYIPAVQSAPTNLYAIVSNEESTAMVKLNSNNKFRVQADVTPTGTCYYSIYGYWYTKR